MIPDNANLSSQQQEIAFNASDNNKLLRGGLQQVLTSIGRAFQGEMGRKELVGRSSHMSSQGLDAPFRRLVSCPSRAGLSRLVAIGQGADQPTGISKAKVADAEESVHHIGCYGSIRSRTHPSTASPPRFFVRVGCLSRAGPLSSASASLGFPGPS